MRTIYEELTCGDMIFYRFRCKKENIIYVFGFVPGGRWERGGGVEGRRKQKVANKRETILKRGHVCFVSIGFNNCSSAT